MSELKQVEKALNVLLKKEYPFIGDVEILRIKELFSDLSADINIYFDIKDIDKFIDKDCYTNVEKDNDIFFALFSYNYCSDKKISDKFVKDTFTTIYKMMGLNKSTIYHTNISVSVIFS